MGLLTAIFQRGASSWFGQQVSTLYVWAHDVFLTIRLMSHCPCAYIISVEGRLASKDVTEWRGVK